MTTPVPTTAAAHLAMVEAMEHASTCRWCSNGDVCDDGQRPAEKLRAALEGWEKREPLRKHAELLHAVYGPLYRATGVGIQEGAWLAGDILDAIEAAMFGTVPRCTWTVDECHRENGEPCGDHTGPRTGGEGG